MRIKTTIYDYFMEMVEM